MKEVLVSVALPALSGYMPGDFLAVWFASAVLVAGVLVVLAGRDENGNWRWPDKDQRRSLTGFIYGVVLGGGFIVALVVYALLQFVPPRIP